MVLVGKKAPDFTADAVVNKEFKKIRKVTLKPSDFDSYLPEASIAQAPIKPRF